MHPSPEMLHHWAYALTPVLLDAVVKGMVLLLAAGLLVLALHRASAALRQMVWLLALAALLALPLVSALLPSWRALPSWAQLVLPAPQQSEPLGIAKGSGDSLPGTNPHDSGAAQVAPTEGSGLPPHIPGQLTKDDTGPRSEVPLARAPQPSVAATAAPPSVTPPTAAFPMPSRWMKVMPWLMLLWAVGIMSCLVPLVLGRLSLWRLARRSRRIEDSAWVTLNERAAKAIDLRRPVTLLQSDAEPMPMVWGLWQSKLLLPAEAETWPQDRRWVVLLHELAHARRRDCLAKLIAQVACAVYWFNPLCWVAFKLMQREAEVACDDLVLAAGHRPSDYAQHLLEIASGLNSGMLASYSSIGMARKSKLEGRLLAILDPRRNRRSLTRLGVLAALILVAGIALPLAIMKAGAADKPLGNSTDHAATPGTSATQPAAEGAYSWPPKVSEDWLTGLWMMKRTDKPGPSEPTVYMTVLNADKTWADIAVWGEPEKPSKVEVSTHGEKWALQENGMPNPLVPVAGPLIVRPLDDGKSTQNMEGLTQLSGSTLTFFIWATDMYLTVEYQRCGPAVEDAIQKALAGSGTSIGKMPAASTVDWPGKPDTKLMTGTWIHDNPSRDKYGDREFVFLTIRPDGTWALGRFYGGPEKPLRAIIDQQGPDWGLTEHMGRVVAAYFDPPPLPTGGGVRWSTTVIRLMPDELKLDRWTYRRASPELAASLAVTAPPALPPTQPALQPMVK